MNDADWHEEHLLCSGPSYECSRLLALGHDALYEGGSLSFACGQLETRALLPVSPGSVCSVE